MICSEYRVEFIMDQDRVRQAYLDELGGFRVDREPVGFHAGEDADEVRPEIHALRIA